MRVGNRAGAERKAGEDYLAGERFEVAAPTLWTESRPF